jgi:hypothetical protein
MKVVTNANLHADEAVVFSGNVLQIAGPADNPPVTGLADFANPELTLALCATASTVGWKVIVRGRGRTVSVRRAPGASPPDSRA